VVESYDQYPDRYDNLDGFWVRSYSEIYQTQPVVAAVVNKIVRQGATMPLKTYRRGDDGEKQRVTSRDDDPGAGLAGIFERPAPRCGPIHVKQWILSPSLVFGNGLLAKFRGDGPDNPPTELLPMDWRFVSAYANAGSVLWWGTTQVSGVERYVPVEETLHFAWDSAGGCLGVSPLHQLAVSLRLEDAAQRWQTSSFRNAARPSSAVTLPQGANPSKDQMRVMRETLESVHRGVDNAFKVALLAPGATWQPMGFNMQEAALVDTRRLNREEVCMVYDVKPSVIGDLSTPGAGYGSVVEINKDFYRSTLRPWLTMIEETIQAQLIDPEPEWDGLFVEFDLSEVLKGEPSAVAAQIATEIASGTMTPAEGRKIQNRSKLDQEGMDKAYLPTNNLHPIGETPAASTPVDSLAVPPQ
jgi:HK97 family phage portal protein